MSFNIKQIRNKIGSVVSPRGGQSHMSGAIAAGVLRDMARPPLSKAAMTGLGACRQREFVNNGSIFQLTPLLLGEVSRVLVKHRDGNSLAWLYLHLQRDVTEGARTLRLNVELASNEAQPLDEDRLGARDIEFVGQWLNTWKPELDTLTDVDLSGNAIDETGLKHLDKILPHITRLNLRENIFKAKVDKAFYKALSNATNLKEADLSVKGLNWKVLCKALQSSKLSKLVISCEHSKTAHQTEIWTHCHLLLGSKHIQHLDLSGQRLFEPSTILITALKDNASLKKLILRGCITRANECLAFIAAIGSHPTLQVANLAGVNLNACCDKLAASLLSDRCSLHTLDLSLIQPDSFGELPLEKDPEYRRLFKRFPKNTTLRSVSIAGHPLNEATQRALVQALETSQLQSLDVRGCGVSNKTLLKCVLRNRSLCELQSDGLGNDPTSRSIRAKLASNREKSPEFQEAIEAATNGIRSLSPMPLPADVARDIAAWSWKIAGDLTDVRNLAYAGSRLSSEASSTT